MIVIGFAMESVFLAIFTACLKYYLEDQTRGVAIAAVMFIYLSALP